MRLFYHFHAHSVNTANAQIYSQYQPLMIARESEFVVNYKTNKKKGTFHHETKHPSNIPQHRHDRSCRNHGFDDFLAS